MDPNGRLFWATSEVLMRRVERAEQGRAIKQIGLGWSEQSKDNQII